MKYKPMWAIIRGTLGVYAMPRTPIKRVLIEFLVNVGLTWGEGQVGYA